MSTRTGPMPLHRYLRIETAISTALNIALAALFTTLMFAGSDLLLWGGGGLALDFLPATFLPCWG